MKSVNRVPAQRAIASSLLVSMLGFSLYGSQTAAQQAPVYGSPVAPTPTASDAYIPPSADQLYQMVAPIALFPDNLVALVLAGSTYPDQVGAANALVSRNPGLTGQALVDTVDQQPWDPSVKALAGFPAVLAQMSSSIDWTSALGQAYYNDPSDVLNAVQVMRQRAQAAGHLSSGSQIVVRSAAPVLATGYAPAPDTPVVYQGPVIVPPPPRAIVIESAQPDVVYVPAYNPALVYGAPVAVYPGYVYAPPVRVHEATVGLLSFGAGIAVGAALFNHVDWGWHSWGMQWAPAHRRSDGYGEWRPAVVHNHTTYVSRTTNIVINRSRHVTNNTTSNVTNNYGGPNGGAPGHHNDGGFGNHADSGRVSGMRPSPQQMQARDWQMRQPPRQALASGPAAMPHFDAGDARPGQRPMPHADAARGMRMDHGARPAMPAASSAQLAHENLAPVHSGGIGHTAMRPVAPAQPARLQHQAHAQIPPPSYRQPPHARAASSAEAQRPPVQHASRQPSGTAPEHAVPGNHSPGRHGAERGDGRHADDGK